MKLLPTLLAIAPFAFLGGGCGGATGGSEGAAGRARPAKQASEQPLSAATGRGPTSTAQIPHYPGVRWYPGDSDGDADHNSDENMRTPGREGSPADRHAIAVAVGRYYSIALAGDGARACAMLAPALVRGIPIEYGRYGPAYLRGDTCAGVMSKLFRHERRQVVAVARTQKLLDVRLEGDHGYAALRVSLPCLKGSCVLDVRTLRIANVLVKREGDSWKIDSLLAVV